jgi:hypothetical protein
MVLIMLEKRLTVLAFSLLTFSAGFFYASPTSAYGSCTQYGIFAMYDILTDSCKCMSGYVFQDNYFGTSCVSASSVCRDKLGYGAQYSSLYDRCECSSGYVLGTDLIGRTQCITEDQACKNQLGSNARSTYGGKCQCSYGYVIDGGRCTDGDWVCSEKHGLYSSYDAASNACECDSGYTFDEDSQCVEKQNNVYFTLKELDTDDRRAIIRSDYDYRYYLISYGSGCYSSSFRRYLGHQIVVNLGTDFDLDVWDRIVLQDDDEVCDITHVERADSETTLAPSNEESDGLGAIPWSIFTVPSPTASVQATDTVTQPSPTTQTNSTPNVPAAGAYNPAKKNLTLISKLSGRILLQVEEHGEAWYINPKDSMRYYMPDGVAAYSMMRSFGLGIADADLNKIPTVDTPQNMLASTSACSNALANRFKGSIMLQVQQHGEAWYIDPTNCRRIYMKDGDAAYQIMRYLGLGITNGDLEKLPSDE